MKIKSLAAALVAVAVLLAGQAHVFAQAPAQFPDTPAAHQFAAWLDAFNSGDRTALSQFLDKNYPTHQGSVDDQMNFRQRTGGFEFKKAEESTPTRFTCLLYTSPSPRDTR